MPLRTDQNLTFLAFTVVLLLFSSTSTATNPEEVPRLPLAMEVFLKIPKERTYDLHIHLTNISDESVTVDLHDLPWNPPNDSKWLSAIRMNDQHDTLKQLVHHWDIGSQEVRLQPGESIQGKILLIPRFPTLLEEIQQFGVQLQWECPPSLLKFMCKNHSSNKIVIPKGDLGHVDVYSVDTIKCRQSADTIGLIKIPKNDEVLFLHTSEAVMADLSQVQTLLQHVATYVQQCQPRWTNSWAVSFFTEAKIAGFLRDVEKEHFFNEGLWQEANIGQYSSQARKLFRFPWVKKKSDEVYLSVYQ